MARNLKFGKNLYFCAANAGVARRELISRTADRRGGRNLDEVGRMAVANEDFQRANSEMFTAIGNRKIEGPGWDLEGPLSDPLGPLGDPAGHLFLPRQNAAAL